MTARIRRLPLGLLAAAAALAGAAPAHAGVLVSSAANCPTQSLSQPFLPWADVAQYSLLPGGSFESGATGWSLSGGAQVVGGNEAFQVGGGSDSAALSLPSGSSATSASMCVGIQNPDLRLFARNTGDPTSTLSVSVIYQTSLGGTSSTQIGTIAAGGSWQPTAQDPILVNLLPLFPNSTTPVAFTFTPQGQGNWQIDDVYVDPWGGH
jgi:hypothetical protein